MRSPPERLRDPLLAPLATVQSVCSAMAMRRCTSAQYASSPPAYRNPSDSLVLPHRNTDISEVVWGAEYAQSVRHYHHYREPQLTMPAIASHYRSPSSSSNPVTVFLYDTSKSSTKPNAYIPVPYRGTPKYNTRRRLGSQILRRRSLSQSSMCSAQSQGYQTPQLMRHSVSLTRTGTETFLYHLGRSPGCKP